MIKLIIIVLLLVGFIVFRRTQRWEKLLGDPKFQKGLMYVGAFAAWATVVFILLAAVETTISILRILEDPSIVGAHSFIGVAFILSVIALAVLYITAYGNPSAVGGFRTTFLRLLFFQKIERQAMRQEKEAERIDVMNVEDEVRKQPTPSDKKDRGSMNHFGIQ